MKRLHAILVLATVVVAWGTTWPVTKLVVVDVPPIWATAFRAWIALIALLIILPATGNLIMPPKSDLPVVFSVAILHMALFSTLVAAGLQFLPAGKAIVIGYTTPLWVALATPLVLHERHHKWRFLGVGLGLLGLSLILNPASINWKNQHTALGTVMILLAAVCWAASILHIRSSSWTSTSLQLLFWQVLAASVTLSLTALALEGWPVVSWSINLVLLLLFGGLVGTAVAYWAVSIASRNLPALTTAMGVTATPLVGIISAAVILGETISLDLAFSAALIVGGIALNLVLDDRKTRP